MRCGYLLWLITAVCMFGLGVGLECYSCPDGTAEGCEDKETCTGGLNSCLKLNAKTGMVYTKCINHADCDFQKLASIFPHVSSFTLDCCQANLCNSSPSSSSTRASPLIGLLAGMAALWWAMQ